MHARPDALFAALADPTRRGLFEKLGQKRRADALLEDWLMQNDFDPVVGRRFNFRAEFLPNGILDCEVLVVEPHRKLSYTWVSASDKPAFHLQSVVTWTLTPTATGTHLRMEQSGFRPEQAPAYQGAKWGWPKRLEAMEQMLARTA